ncbi:MAG: sensor histidine kinase [Bilifractor sp.]
MKKKKTLSQHIRKVIVLCCTIAILLQVVITISVVFHYYIRKEEEDTQYLLQSDNEMLNTSVRFLEERILAIQNDENIMDFFLAEVYSASDTENRLQTQADLFSERNRQGNSEPFVTGIYLFNNRSDCVSTIYYPLAASEKAKDVNEMQVLRQKYLQQTKPFYIENDLSHFHLCLYLYDSVMHPLGTCIVSLNPEYIEGVYTNLESLRSYSWSLTGQDGIVVADNHLTHQNLDPINNTMQSGFGLTIQSSVDRWEIYQTLEKTIILLLSVSAAVIVCTALIGSAVAHKAVRPLETIADKIQLVKEGHYDTRLGEYQTVELSNISDTFNGMTEHMNHLVNQVYETRLLHQESKIKYLQSQMNPHFLFNILSMIGMKAAVHGDKETQKLIFMLSRLLQGKIFRKNEIEIKLSEEMEIVEFYLYLQNSRFGDKITYSVEYKGADRDQFASLMVPRLCIEPLVENAVAHGLEPKEGNGHISVIISRNKNLTVTIEDDGVGFDKDTIGKENQSSPHTHVGLFNIDRILKNLYGDTYGVSVESHIGTGTRVNVIFPLIERQEED